jgi:hypothetical protein
LLGAGLPQPNGSLWVLGGGSSDRTLQDVNLLNGHVAHIVPVESTAQWIAQSADGTLAVGDDDGAGTIHFRDPGSGAVTSTVTVGAPIRDIAADGSAGRFYVLDGTASASTVNVVQTGNRVVLGAHGVALGALSIAASPDGSQLFVLTSSGSVSEVPMAANGNVATSTFSVGGGGSEIALSGDGSTLFVLAENDNVDSVGVVNVATERRTTVLPAPSNSVGIVVSLDGTQIYLLVGTASVGNIQVFPVGR